MSLSKGWMPVTRVEVQPACRQSATGTQSFRSHDGGAGEVLRSPMPVMSRRELDPLTVCGAVYALVSCAPGRVGPDLYANVSQRKQQNQNDVVTLNCTR